VSLLVRRFVIAANNARPSSLDVVRISISLFIESKAMRCRKLPFARPAFLVLLCAFILSSVVTAAPRRSRRRRRRPARKTTVRQTLLPGYMQLPSAVRIKLRRRFQQQLDDRKKRRHQAGRNALRWKRQAATASNPEETARLLCSAAAAAIDARRWSMARELFADVAKRFPESPWAAESRLFLFDLAVDRDQDFSAAEKQLFALLPWAKTISPPVHKSGTPVSIKLVTTPSGGRGPGGLLPLGSPGPIIERDGKDHSLKPRTQPAIAADVFLHAGLLAWLNGDAANMRRSLERVVELDPGLNSPLMNLVQIKFGHPPALPIPPPVAEGPVELVRLIRFAAVLEKGRAAYRSLHLWDILARKRDLSPLHKSFVLYHRGLSRYRLPNPLEKEPSRIQRDYETSFKLAPKSPWAGQVLLLAGNVTWNLLHDADTAVRLWRKVLKSDPRSPHAPRAAYFIGVIYEQDRRWKSAHDAFTQAKTRFPDSPYNKLIDQHLKTVNGELKRPSTRKPASRN